MMGAAAARHRDDRGDPLLAVLPVPYWLFERHPAVKEAETFKSQQRRRPMNRQARGLLLVIGGALLATACAPTGITSYGGREVLAPTQKLIEEAKTKADHEALAVYYEGEAQALHEKTRYYQRMADQRSYRGSAYRILYGPRYEALAQKYQSAEEENLKQAKQHRELASEAER